MIRMNLVGEFIKPIYLLRVFKKPNLKRRILIQCIDGSLVFGQCSGQLLPANLELGFVLGSIQAIQCSLDVLSQRIRQKRKRGGGLRDGCQRIFLRLVVIGNCRQCIYNFLSNPQDFFYLGQNIVELIQLIHDLVNQFIKAIYDGQPRSGHVHLTGNHAAVLIYPDVVKGQPQPGLLEIGRRHIPGSPESAGP